MTRNVPAMLGLALLLGLGAQAPYSPPPPHYPPPPRTQQPQVTPPPCDPKDSADYVPGVDAYGRPVAPADLSSDTNITVSREIYPTIKSKNPNLGGTGLAVRIDGLGRTPACPPAPRKPGN